MYDMDTLQAGLQAINSEEFSAVIADLDPSARAELSAMCEFRTVKAREILIADAERPDHLGYVLEGVLGMRKVLPDGRAHMIGILVPTDVYGRVFHHIASFQIEALTAGKVFCIARQPLEQFLLQHLAVERHFLANTLDELDAMREWILLIGARKIASRVASLLLILGRRSMRRATSAPTEGVTLRITIPISRTNMAEYLGTTPESLSRALRMLARDGVIDLIDAYNLEIRDLNRLMQIAGNSPHRAD